MIRRAHPLFLVEALIGSIVLFLAPWALATPPAPPSLIKVAQTISSTTQKGFVCQWLDNSDDEDLFEIRMRVGNVGAFTTVNYVLNNAQFGTWYASNRFLSSVPAGTQLQFQVLAEHATIVRDQTTNTITDFTVTERSLPSNTLSVTYAVTTPDGTLYPPSNLQAILISDGKLQMQWHDNSLVEDGFSFFVKKSTDAAYPAAEGFSLPFGLTDFTIPAYSVAFGTDKFGLVPGLTYNMKVAAVQGQTNTSAFSNEVTFTMPLLNAPTNLVVTQVSETSLNFTWKDNSFNEHGYVIQLAIGAPIGDITWDSVQADVTTYHLQNLIPGTSASWKVVGAFNPGDGADYILSPPSNVVDFQAVMGAPQNLAASVTDDAVSGVTTTRLTWHDTSTAETNTLIMARETGTTDDYVEVKRVAPNANTTTLTRELTPGKQFDLIVRGVYVGSGGAISGKSADSNVVQVSTKDNFTSATSKPAVVGQSFSYQMTTSSLSPRTSLAVTGMPAGLMFDSSTGAISGTPTESGVFTLVFSAAFANGWTAHSTLTLRIPKAAAAPTITGALAARTLNVAAPVSVALSDFFTDADTERAVRMVTTLGNIDVVLYPSLVPQTMANFFAYADNGDYTGTVFHRVSPGFVLQGGGYKVLTDPDTFAEVTRRPSPMNEPGISNLKGTLAMAKGSDPNSATHDFFFNLADNTSLDTNTGGFTVFGRVVNSHLNADGIDATVQALIDKPGAKYAIKLRPSGSTEIQSNFNPLNGLGDTERWPLNADPAPATMDSTKVLSILAILDMPNLIFGITTMPDSNVATAEIVGGTLKLTGIADGTTSVGISATDVDGNTVVQTFALHVDQTFEYPLITQPPVNATVLLDAPASFTVGATGTDPRYQWRKGGVAIQDATGPSLNFLHAQRGDEGSYDVVVSNASGSVTSSAVTLTVNSPPVIVTDPVSISRNYGGSASFTVVADGSAALAYTWFKGTTLITGATGPTLTLPSLLLTAEADYHAVVSNGFGSPATSASVHLTVVRVDTDGDGLFDDQEVGLGTDKTKADTDGDGYTDAVEVALGSNPSLATSTPATGYFAAQRDGLGSLSSIGLKRLTGGTYPDALNANASVTVPDQWLALTEMTNEQFASVLQYAVKTLDVAEIVSAGGRRFVRYPKTTGETVCFLADATASPPSGDINADASGQSFFVTKALAKNPARSVSWYGAYLATVVMNARHGYPAKCVPATWSYASGNGYSLPAFTAWGWAARGGAAAYLYPTGATVTTKLANYGSTATKSVGSYTTGKLGFFDMAGNVGEWVGEGDSTTGYVRGGGYADAAPALLNSTWQTVLKSTLSKSTGLRLALQEAAAPSFVAHPQPVFIKTGQGISLGATASGAPPLTYQWLRNDVALPGKTAATLTIASATLADGGAYGLRVTSNGVSTTSNAASVAVVEVPSPVLRSTIAPNKSAAFAVHVSGAPGQVFDYDWSRTLFSLSNDYTVHGVDKPTLQIVSAQQGMTDTYFCSVSVHDAPSVAPIVVPYELVVYSVPVIAPASQLPYAVVGGAYTYQVPFDPALELGITQWSATGLPKGFTINPKTGVITGTSATPISTNPQITAINPFGRTTSSVKLVVSGLPAGMTGNYTSTMARHALNKQHGGRLDLTVSDSAVVTGKLIMEGVPYPLTATLAATVDPAGGAVSKQAAATFTVVRKGLLSLKIKVFLDAANNALTGTVGEVPAAGGEPASTAALTGWHAADIVSARLGYHTVVLIPPGGVTDPALVPQGTSFASIKVADSGATTVAGTLADGTTFTSAGWLGPDQVIVYAPLYNLRGSILGTLRIAQDTAHTIGLGLGDHVSWQHDDLGVASIQRSYKRGFGPLELSVLAGGKYSPPAANTLVMGLTDTSTPAPAANNAELGFSSGGLAAPFVQDLRITTLNKAVFPVGSNAHAVTLTVTPTTGLFLGTCQIVDGTIKRSVNYAGAIVPDNAHAGKGIGYGFFTLPQLPDPAKTSPILSGKVLFGTIPAPN